MFPIEWKFYNIEEPKYSHWKYHTYIFTHARSRELIMFPATSWKGRKLSSTDLTSRYPHTCALPAPRECDQLYVMGTTLTKSCIVRNRPELIIELGFRLCARRIVPRTEIVTRVGFDRCPLMLARRGCKRMLLSSFTPNQSKGLRDDAVMRGSKFWKIFSNDDITEWWCNLEKGRIMF